MKVNSQYKHFGFTIIELIVVILLIAIIAKFSVSNWVATVNPNAAAQQLAADIRYTQFLSMTHGNRFALTLTAPNTYTISTCTGPTLVHSSVTGGTTTTLSGVTFGTLTNLPNNIISFDEQGVPYTNACATSGNTLATAASIPIVGGSVTRTITIAPTTGNVDGL